MLPVTYEFKLGRNLVIVGVVFLLVYVVSFLDLLAPLNQSLSSYVELIWWPVVLGLLVGGILDYFVPSDLVIRYLGQPKKASLIYATGIGFAMSACSHGMLAIAIQLYKKGAGVPVVVTFLLASPWANLPITVLLFGVFGWKAMFFILGAMLIALTTGFVYTALDRLGWIEGSYAGEAEEGARKRRADNVGPARALAGVAHGTLALANMVLWWILIGVLIAAVIGAYVPQQLFMEFLGPDLTGMLAALAAATVLEVCSEGTAPIAFEIYDKVGSLGSPFIFLLAGVATDYTEIGLIWSNIGRRAAIWLPLVTVPQILLYATALNLFVDI